MANRSSGLGKEIVTSIATKKMTVKAVASIMATETVGEIATRIASGMIMIGDAVAGPPAQDAGDLGAISPPPIATLIVKTKGRSLSSIIIFPTLQ